MLSDISSLMMDEEDTVALQEYKFYISLRGYVLAYDKKKKKLTPLHRLLMNPPSELVVDHRDGNPLNNKKDNLRVCTRMDNSVNMKAHKDKKDGLPKGIYFKYNRPSPFAVMFTWQGTRISYGCYKTLQEAEIAYNKASEFYNGNFALHKSRSETK